MKDFSPNHYERAFENWLIDNRIQYIAVDEHPKPFPVWRQDYYFRYNVGLKLQLAG